jgi:hypothetical protein
MRSRLQLGRDALVVRETDDEVELESCERLAPGRAVLMFRPGSDRGRTALVVAWRLVLMGSQGPLYRGCCRWIS